MSTLTQSGELARTTHRAKIVTKDGIFVFGVRDALGASPLTPSAQDEDVSIEFLDGRGMRRRYAFRTFSEFFHAIRDSAVPVDGMAPTHE